MKTFFLSILLQFALLFSLDAQQNDDYTRTWLDNFDKTYSSEVDSEQYELANAVKTLAERGYLSVQKENGNLIWVLNTTAVICEKGTPALIEEKTKGNSYIKVEKDNNKGTIGAVMVITGCVAVFGSLPVSVNLLGDLRYAALSKRVVTGGVCVGTGLIVWGSYLLFSSATPDGEAIYDEVKLNPFEILKYHPTVANNYLSSKSEYRFKRAKDAKNAVETLTAELNTLLEVIKICEASSSAK